MKTFTQREFKQAISYSMSGGVATHLHMIVFPKSPKCFKKDVKAGVPIAHVFCQDAELLETIALKCGVHQVVIEHKGTSRQHVDMCGLPLKRLLKELQTA